MLALAQTHLSPPAKRTHTSTTRTCGVLNKKNTKKIEPNNIQFVLNTCRYEAPFTARIDAVVGVTRSEAATMTSIIAALDNVRVILLFYLVIFLLFFIISSEAATMTSMIAALDNVRVSELSVYLNPAPSPLSPPPPPHLCNIGETQSRTHNNAGASNKVLGPRRWLTNLLRTKIKRTECRCQ
jgi:hypothetical protein